MSDLPRGVEYVGPKTRDDVRRLMRDATIAIVPSVCYENFPLVIVEAFSTGLPVVAARLGAMEELLRGEDAGWLVDPADPGSLARTIELAWNSQADIVRRGKQARRYYEARYTPELNHRVLMRIYDAAMSESAGRRSV